MLKNKLQRNPGNWYWIGNRFVKFNNGVLFELEVIQISSAPKEIANMEGQCNYLQTTGQVKMWVRGVELIKRQFDEVTRLQYVMLMTDDSEFEVETLEYDSNDNLILNGQVYPFEIVTRLRISNRPKIKGSGMFADALYGYN